jgi:predicted enzyme involved in methoxymalonyl-ACP biosynthesis
MQVRLTDTFGDNGMISVIICRPNAEGNWDIDTWLMSCRVLGRGVEKMVLREMLEHASERGVKKLIGAYRPTDRNKLVEEHYSKLGFTEVERGADGTTVWELDVASANVEPCPMRVRSEGFSRQASVALQGQ